jgi:RNA polymerase sigma factor (sigma-70 family)
MLDDAELLRCFAESGAEDAFAELVRRHLDFTYSVALRRVGHDAHLADEVCQDVFCALARKAKVVSRLPALKAWLHTAVHYAAANAVRATRRRRAREEEVLSMHELDERTPPSWHEVAPVIDAAINQLNEADRTAVLLRFFEEHSFSEIGRRLGLSEDAARMRLDRALDKLCGLLSTRGVKSSAAALALCLSHSSVVAAPSTLGPSIVGAAKAATAGGATLAALYHSMTLANTKTVIAGVIGLVLATTITFQTVGNARLAKQRADLEVQHARVVELRSENEALQREAEATQIAQDEAAELEHLRSTRTAKPTAGSPASVSVAPPIREGLVPTSILRNRGNTTPEAAFETLYWAKLHHDFATLTSLIATAPEHRADTDSTFAHLSTEARAKYPEATTPEEYFAREWETQSGREAALQIDAAMAIDTDHVYLSGHRQLEGERGASNFDIVLRRTDDGWKWFPHENSPAAALKLTAPRAAATP